MNYIATHSNALEDKNYTVAVVEGAPVHFPGFEAFEFFSHEPLWGDGYSWNVIISEKSTGGVVGGGLTYEEAYKAASAHLNGDGPEGFAARIDRVKNCIKTKTFYKP